MNAPDKAVAPKHFQYYPGNYRWSAEIMAVLSAAPYGGADLSEVDRMGRQLRDRVGDDEAWFDVWCEGSELLRVRAQELEKKGHKLTAANNYLRACFYYQIADHFRQPKDERALSAFKTSLDCFRKFAELNDSPKVEIVELPSKHGSFPGIFVHALNPKSKKTPCVVRFGGFDTQKEMQYVRGTPDLVRRGISYLLVDGPGQGGTLRRHRIPTRYDYEVPVGRCIDWLSARDDIDPKRIAVSGSSLGGYYAARAGSREPRLAFVSARPVSPTFRCEFPRARLPSVRTAASCSVSTLWKPACSRPSWHHFSPRPSEPRTTS